MSKLFGIEFRPRAVLSSTIGFISIFLATVCNADECSPLKISLWPSVQLVSQDSSICGGRLSLVWGKNTAVRGIDIGIVNGVESIKDIQPDGLNMVSGRDKTESWGLEIAGLNYARDTKYTGIQIGLANIELNTVMNGLQVSLLNYAEEANGIQLAIIGNDTKKYFYGVQMAWGLNGDRGLDMHGIQISSFGNMAGDVNGLQISVFGNGADDMHGAQAGILNFAPEVHGVQIGGFNVVDREVHGVQIGWLNGAKNVHGIQIGVINWCDTLDGVQIGIANIVKSRYSSGGFFFTPLINVGF
jgi:hypothetical protein